MGEFALDVAPRDGRGKGVARRLRAAGRIPAICYKHGGPSVAVSVEARALDRLLRTSSAGMNTLIDLKVSGGGDFDGAQVLVKELQRDPVDKSLVHADLFAVDLTESIHVSIPVHLDGTPHGVTMGGVMDHALREIEVECLPNAIPEEIRIDVAALDIGDSLHVRDLTLPDGVELLTDADLSVVSVVAPTVAEEEAPAEEGEELAEGEAASGEAASDEKAESAEESSDD